MKYVALALAVVCLTGCASIQRVPGSAIKKSPVIYLTHSDRIPKEAISAEKAAAVGPQAVGEEIAKIAGAVTKEMVKAYEDVERNTATRSVEVFISGYESVTGAELNDIVNTFQEITKQQFPTK